MRVRNVPKAWTAGLLVTFIMLATQAQAAAPTAIRGTIETVGAHEMTVQTRTGASIPVALADPLAVLTVKNVALSAIDSGSYVGIATRTAADGTQQAIEVLVFPEAMRGAGEGSYPWTLEPGSTMTNGSVKGVVKAASATELTVTYKDSSKIIQVAPGAPIVTFAPAERADVKPGVPVFLMAPKAEDGSFTAARVVVGKDGVAPPM